MDTNDKDSKKQSVSKIAVTRELDLNHMSNEDRALFDQTIFLILCKMGVNAGEALVLVSREFTDLARSWISEESVKHLCKAKLAQDIHSTKSKSLDALDIKLIRIFQDLAYTCLIHSLEKDVHIEINRILQETDHATRNPGGSASYKSSTNTKD